MELHKGFYCKCGCNLFYLNKTDVCMELHYSYICVLCGKELYTSAKFEKMEVDDDFKKFIYTNR